MGALLNDVIPFSPAEFLFSAVFFASGKLAHGHMGVTSSSKSGRAGLDKKLLGADFAVPLCRRNFTVCFGGRSWS
jgi:hypothetical protein